MLPVQRSNDVNPVSAILPSRGQVGTHRQQASWRSDTVADVQLDGREVQPHEVVGAPVLSVVEDVSDSSA